MAAGAPEITVTFQTGGKKKREDKKAGNPASLTLPVTFHWPLLSEMGR